MVLVRYFTMFAYNRCLCAKEKLNRLNLICDRLCYMEKCHLKKNVRKTETKGMKRKENMKGNFLKENGLEGNERTRGARYRFLILQLYVCYCYKSNYKKCIMKGTIDASVVKENRSYEICCLCLHFMAENVIHYALYLCHVIEKVLFHH